MGAECWCFNIYYVTRIHILICYRRYYMSIAHCVVIEISLTIRRMRKRKYAVWICRRNHWIIKIHLRDSQLRQVPFLQFHAQFFFLRTANGNALWLMLLFFSSFNKFGFANSPTIYSMYAVRHFITTQKNNIDWNGTKYKMNNNNNEK